MMKPTLCSRSVGLFLLLLLGGCAGTNTPGTPPPLRLDNGQDLTGWDFYLVDPKVKITEVWSVEDGAIICQGKPKGYLSTVGTYRNYKLRLSWRWAPGGKGGNSGVLLSCAGPGKFKPWPRCLEAQLKSGNAGDFVTLGKDVRITVPDQAKRQKGIVIANLSDHAEKPIGQWNTMEIVHNRGEIRIWVNGKLVNEGTDCSEKSGPIALQSEGAEIHFRQILLTPLPD